MPNILENYTKTKKGQKEFNSLPAESKAKIIEAAIIEKASGAMAKEIAKSMISGMEMEREHIYKQFVSKIDAFSIESVEWFDAVDKLLSYIRVKHLNYLTTHPKNEEKEGNSNESENEGLAKS